MTTTWDPTSPPFGATFTNGNMTVESWDPTSSGQDQAVSTTNVRQDGKYVCIFRIDTAGINTFGVGWAVDGGSLYKNADLGGFRCDSVSWRPNGDVWFNNAIVATVATYASGDIVYIATQRVRASSIFNLWFG